MRTTNLPQQAPIAGFETTIEQPLKDERVIGDWRTLESTFFALAWRLLSQSWKRDNHAIFRTYQAGVAGSEIDQEAVVAKARSLLTAVTDPCIKDNQLEGIIRVILMRKRNDPDWRRLPPSNQNPLTIPITDPDSWAVLGSSGQRWFFMLLHQWRHIFTKKVPTALEIFSTVNRQHLGIRWKLTSPNQKLYQEIHEKILEDANSRAKALKGVSDPSIQGVLTLLSMPASCQGYTQTHDQIYGGHGQQLGSHQSHTDPMSAYLPILGQGSQTYGQGQHFGNQPGYAGLGAADPQNIPQGSQTFGDYYQQLGSQQGHADPTSAQIQGVQKSQTFGGYDQRFDIEPGFSYEPIRKSHTFGGYDQRAGTQPGGVDPGATFPQYSPHGDQGYGEYGHMLGFQPNPAGLGATSFQNPPQGGQAYSGYGQSPSFQPGFAGSGTSFPPNVPQGFQEYGEYGQQSGSQQRRPGTETPYPPPYPQAFSQQERYEMYSAP